MATIETIHKIKYGAQSWTVPPNCVKDVDGDTFVKLPRSSKGFAKLVFENNPNLPNPIPPSYSLTASKGYGELLDLRKAAAIAEKAQRSGISALFQSGYQNRASVKRKDIAESRDKPAVVTLSFQAKSVRCLATECDRDALCIFFDAIDITACIEFMRESPWDSSLMKGKREVGCLVPRKDRKGHTHFYERDHASKKLKRLLSEQSEGVASTDANEDEDTPLVSGDGSQQVEESIA